MDELRLVKGLSGSIENTGHAGFTDTHKQNLNTKNTSKAHKNHFQTLLTWYVHKPEQRGHRNWPVLHSYAQFTDLEQPLIRHFHTLKTKAEIMPFHINKRFANKFSKQNTREQNPLNLWGAYRDIIHKCLWNLARSLKCLSVGISVLGAFLRKQKLQSKTHLESLCVSHHVTAVSCPSSHNLQCSSCWTWLNWHTESLTCRRLFTGGWR